MAFEKLKPLDALKTLKLADLLVKEEVARNNLDTIRLPDLKLIDTDSILSFFYNQDAGNLTFTDALKNMLRTLENGRTDKVPADFALTFVGLCNITKPEFHAFDNGTDLLCDLVTASDGSDNLRQKILFSVGAAMAKTNYGADNHLIRQLLGIFNRIKKHTENDLDSAFSRGYQSNNQTRPS